MSEMSQASAPDGGDPLGLPGALPEAGDDQARPAGSGDEPGTGTGQSPPPAAEVPGGADARDRSESDVEALSRTTSEDPAAASDPMPDVAGQG